MRLSRRLAPLLAVVSVSILSYAQQSTSPPSPLTLEGAVNYALGHYPQIRTSLERRSAASAGVGLAKAAYLPTGNALWQSNRATRNNIFGLLLPQSVIPPLTGPVLPDTSNRAAWGSAGGVLASWEALDFGYRRARVDVARADEDTASAEVEISRLDVANATASAFISVIEAQEAIRAAEADVNRREVQDLSAQAAEAHARLEGAIEIAQTTGVELDAARAAESQARARYEAALANVVEVTDAEGLLVRSETDDAVSRLNAWRALAAFAAAQRDLSPFLQSVHNASTGGH